VSFDSGSAQLRVDDPSNVGGDLVVRGSGTTIAGAVAAGVNFIDQRPAFTAGAGATPQEVFDQAVAALQSLGWTGARAILLDQLIDLGVKLGILNEGIKSASRLNPFSTDLP